MRSQMRGSIMVGALLLAPGAWAQDEAPDDDGEPTTPPLTTINAPLPPPPPPEDDLPIPTLTIDRVPPRTSFEFAVHVSYGQVAYFTDAVPSWIGFGMRGGWGRNFGLHRIGVAGTVIAEGDFGVHTLAGFEPTVNWDFVSPKGLLLGVGAGPALMFTHNQSQVEIEQSFEVAPSAAARIGWSQTWSRVGRRLFVFLEPKIRWTPEGLTPLVAIAVGSGGGR